MSQIFARLLSAFFRFLITPASPEIRSVLEFISVNSFSEFCSRFASPRSSSSSPGFSFAESISLIEKILNSILRAFSFSSIWNELILFLIMPSLSWTSLTLVTSFESYLKLSRSSLCLAILTMFWWVLVLAMYIDKVFRYLFKFIKRDLGGICNIAPCR